MSGYSIINLRNANEIFQQMGLVFIRHNLGHYKAMLDGEEIDADAKLSDLVQRVAAKMVKHYKVNH